MARHTEIRAVLTQVGGISGGQQLKFVEFGVNLTNQML
jgi:hypothetical protein